MDKSIIYGSLAGLYDGLNASKDYPGEARYLLRLGTRWLGRTPTSLLDVGCGTGVHLAEFRKTLSVAGVDQSPEMLQVARRRLGRKVSLVRGDMRRFALGRTFDMVTCLFSAIGYMETRNDRDRAIANFYRHLNPGGVALVEGWVLPERWRGKEVASQTFEGPNTRVAQVVSAWRERDHSVVDFHWLVAERGQRVRHYAELVRNPLVEADDLLGSFRRAGFRARVMRRGRYRDRGLYVGVRADEASGGARGAERRQRSERLRRRAAR